MRSPVSRHQPLGDVDAQVTHLDQRPRLGRGPPQDRPQAREQLVDTERLRHVVVRPRVQGRDLLPLLAHRGEDDHRRLAPRPELTADVGAAPVGKHEIEDHRRGWMGGRRRERARGGVRGVNLESRTAQSRAERPQDLRLVVDDEDPLLHAGSSAGTSTTGSASANVAPCPGFDSAQRRPPFAAAKPRAIARPRPAPERWSPPLR